MVKEAYKFSLPPLIAGAAAAFFFRESALGLWAGGILIFLGVFVLYFFRDPERTPPADADAVVSPADGRVTAIVDEEFEGRPGKRVSIFLSVWDVHVNRAPMAGKIRKVEYRPGRFYAAMRARASQENEQNVFTVETDRGEMSFKQIAGWIARRVVSWKAAGDAVATGERIGLIRFGSRMDVWLPPEAEIVAKKGQFVAAGSSTLARWPHPGRKPAGK
jgi:phosphatidylserine decarboxylase